MSLGDWWTKLWVPKPNAECPVCGVPVVAGPNVGLAPGGRIAIPRPPEELIAACPEHGRAPFNDASLKHLKR